MRRRAHSRAGAHHNPVKCFVERAAMDMGAAKVAQVGGQVRVAAPAGSKTLRYLPE